MITITFEDHPVTTPEGGIGELSIAASGVTFTSRDAGLKASSSHCFSSVPPLSRHVRRVRPGS